MIFRDLTYGTSFKRVGYCDKKTYIKVLYKDTNKPKAYCLENNAIYNFPTNTEVKMVSAREPEYCRTETVLLNDTLSGTFTKLIVTEEQIRMLDYIIDDLCYEDITYYRIGEDIESKDLTKGV